MIKKIENLLNEKFNIHWHLLYCIYLDKNNGDFNKSTIDCYNDLIVQKKDLNQLLKENQNG
jgi:hypothetical protein